MITNKKKAVIFIHGFCSNDSSWKKLRSMISADDTFGNIKFESFEYDSALFKINTQNKLIYRDPTNFLSYIFYKDDHSISELAHILDKRISSLNDCDEIALICHSMGGLIARRYIVDNSPTKVSKLIMFGTPIHGTNFANFLNLFIRHNSQLKDLRKNSSFLKKLNFEWEVYRKEHDLKVINFATNLDTYTTIKEFKTYWTHHSDKLIIIKNKLHYFLNMPNGEKDEILKIIKSELSS